MRRMSALSPKIQELREKYKDDPTRMNQEAMKLYKEYGINPVGGCLPMLIQIPIFFGLFTMLRQAVELRGAHFSGFAISLNPTSSASSRRRVAHQYSSTHHGGDQFLDDPPDAEEWRSHPAADDDVHAHNLYRLLL